MVVSEIADVDLDALFDGLEVAGLLAVQRTAERRLRDASLARLSVKELLAVLDARETERRSREIFDAALYVEGSDRLLHQKAGFATFSQLYSTGLRLGAGEAGRRKKLALALGRFTLMTGEKSEPLLPETAKAVAAGEVGRDQVLTIAAVMEKIPHSVPTEDHESAEAMLAEAAHRLGPDGVATAGHSILAWLDPDGRLSDDVDRQRQRGLVLSPQDRQLMRKIQGQLTPTAAVALEITLLHWAARGMNNPEDPESPRGADDQPGLDPAVLADAAERDTRSIGQRQHDALEALANWERNQTLAGTGRDGAGGAVSSTVVVTVTDEDLARGAGIAWTTTGTQLPVSDLVKLAADTIPYLAVFSEATGQVLYLGRANRFASKAQRLALFARDRGCTAPGCSRPWVATQAHHMPDWADGGPTDIDHLGGACGGDNRKVGKGRGQWETRILTEGPDRGRVGWRPTGSRGKWQINPIHHPDQLIHRDDTGPPDMEPDCRSVFEQQLEMALAA